MGLKNFVFPDIALGMNSLADPYELRPGESPSSLNVSPALRGDAWTRRNGLKLFNGAAAAGMFMDTLLSWNNEFVDQIVVARGDEISSTSVAADVSTAWTVRFAGIGGIDVAADMEIARNAAGVETLYIVGTTPAQKWNGIAATTSNWNVLPAGPIAIKLWKNRIVAGADLNNPERIYYSPVGDPEGTFKTIDIRSAYDDDDPITDFELIGDNLLVFKRHSTWLVYDINTFANRRLGYPGVPHRKLSANLNGIVYFASKDNLWYTDGIGQPRPVDQRISTAMTQNEIFDEASQLMADPIAQRLLFVKLHGVVGGATEVIEYYPPQSLNNPRKEGTWWKHSFTPAIRRMFMVQARTTSVGAGFDRHIMAVDMNDDLHFAFEDNTDNGTTIAGSWASGVIQLTEMEKLERVRRCNVRTTAPVTVTLSTPGATNFVASVTSVDSAGFVKVKPELRGREFQVKFDTVGANALTVRDIELVFRGGKEKK